MVAGACRWRRHWRLACGAGAGSKWVAGTQRGGPSVWGLLKAARCGGGKEAPEASRTAPGVPGGLLASLPRPGLPPPPAVPRGGQGRASGGSACSSELAISGRRLAFQNAILSSYKSRPGRHGHWASLRMQGRPEAQPRRGRGGGRSEGPHPRRRPRPSLRGSGSRGSGTLSVCRVCPEQGRGRLPCAGDPRSSWIFL